MPTLKHEWLTIYSERTQPYGLEDISVIIPSAAGRYEKRWKWFWKQYVAKTHPIVVENTYVPCDEEEVQFLHKLGIKNTIVTTPRFIVPKTLHALDFITTRLTFRLANDIMVVRSGWEDILLNQFNAEEKLQLIGELQNGTVYPDTSENLRRDWSFVRREYRKVATASEYLHGSRLFAQTAVWNAYYRLLLRYTTHDHDEIYFCQLARGDGILFTRFRGSNLYLAHKGISNQDFTKEDIQGIEKDRRYLEKAEDKHEFTRIR